MMVERAPLPLRATHPGCLAGVALRAACLAGAATAALAARAALVRPSTLTTVAMIIMVLSWFLLGECPLVLESRKTPWNARNINSVTNSRGSAAVSCLGRDVPSVEFGEVYVCAPCTLSNPHALYPPYGHRLPHLTCVRLTREPNCFRIAYRMCPIGDASLSGLAPLCV